MVQMRVFRAICILVAHLILLGLGTPGLDLLPRQYLRSEKAQARMEAKYGATQTAIAVVAADLNRKRFWIEDTAGKIQPVFRIAQSWHLYRDGPTAIRKLEVQVDGVPVYRTNDANLDWLAPILRNRRIRPVTETTVAKAKAGNRLGLGRLIVERAKADFPRVRRIDIVSLAGQRPGENLQPRHRMVATAPDWKLEDQWGSNR